MQERLRGWPALLLRAREERAHLAPMLEALDEEDQVGAPLSMAPLSVAVPWRSTYCGNPNPNPNHCPKYPRRRT